MGADKAILIKSENSRFMSSHHVANNLADALKDRDFDLILCGKKSVDTDSQQVGSLTAMNSGLPVITSVINLEINDNKVTAGREVEGGNETVTCQLPAVITCEKGLNEPRYPNLKGIMMAKKKPIEEIVIEGGGAADNIRSMEYPPQKAEGRIVGEGAGAAPELARLLREEAKVI